MSESPRRSILSHGERDVAARLADGRSIEEIAEARDTSEEAVEKAVARIRRKTGRAVATLLQSPFAAEAVRELDSERRQELCALLADEDD